MNDTPEYQDIDKGLADLELKVKNSNRALDNLFKGLGIGAEERAGAVPPQVNTEAPARRLADDEVLGALAKFTFDKQRKLAMPPVEQLDARLFGKVKSVLASLGGKWNTSASAFVFKYDPEPKIADMLSSGAVVNHKKEAQAFFTPSDLAHRVVGLARVKGQVVLEPSAGEGALADACIAQGAKRVDCVEKDENYAGTLKQKGYIVVNDDFLSLPVQSGAGGYSRIVMNPPFSGGQFIQHIVKALEWLQPGGSLVSVIPGGKDQPKLAQALAGRQFVVTPLDQGAFKASGTAVGTSIVIVKG
jgi:hypothetical protein